jgi:hypothetical protein
MSIPVRAALALLGLSIAVTGQYQYPYRVAGDHCHLVFENPWVRATRVTYGPSEYCE